MRIALSLCAAVVCASGIRARAEIGSAREDAGKAALAVNPDLVSLPGSVLVKFREGAPVNARAQARIDIDATLLRSYRLVAGLERLQTDRDVQQAILSLKANPWVEYAEPDYVVHPTATTPNDQFFGLQWGLHNTGQTVNGMAGANDADIDMPQAWDIATGSASVIVAVLDTGTEWHHPDLDDNIWTNTGEIPENGVDDDFNGYIDDVRGWDFFDNDNDPDDGSGHGTHTAGTVGAEGDNGQGVAGVVWNVQIMPLRFLGPGGGSTSDAVRALEYAVENGARISNNSWGGGPFSASMRDAILAAAAEGHLFVSSAGNDGDDTDALGHYPSGYDAPNILSIANMQNDDTLRPTSNYGATTVDLGAPGTNIVSTWPGSGYVYLSGTSMASPHVAGVAALLLSENPGWGYVQLKQRIMESVRPVAALSGKSVTGGVLNAALAIEPPPPPPPTCGEGVPDFNKSGAVGGEDLAVLLSQWGFTPGVPGDLTGNGWIDGEDLAIFLTMWGPCPE
jgi:subtilisin family serine protease